MTMPEESRRLLEALVAAYPDHVRRRVGAREVAGLDGAIEAGRRWLEESLTELLSLPFTEQRRGPLELFQAAMVFPTECMAEAGLEPVSRDPVAEAALPGDVYDLAPASTRDLGEEVWSLHLAWGAAKAAAFRRRPAPPPDADER
ncbi:MAG: hypothetical protein FWJ92_03895 [Actinomycetes bacterium]|jgi:hypothetical protein|nr:hypothetical protein [Acidimicrobiia bacterium]